MYTRRTRAAILVAFVAAAVPAATQAQSTTYSAEVRRTSFGIAHVKAADYAGLGYGVGYAFAQDNFCMMADEIVSVNAERSRYFGASGTSPLQVNNLFSDVFYAYFNSDTAALQAGFGSMKPEVQAAFRG